MRVQLSSEVTIDAPADDVWRVVGEEFGEIDRWSSGIRRSASFERTTKETGDLQYGRVCDGIQERLIYFQGEQRRLGYTMVDPPWYINEVGNHWLVKAIDSGTSIVEMQPEVDFKFLPGLVLAPMLWIAGRLIARRVFDELKTYVESGQPHKRKQSQQRQEPLSVAER